MSLVYQSLTDEHAIAQQELNQYVEAQARVVAPEIEIDSDPDKEFGVLYRVWNSSALLGTFYRALDGKWVVQSCNSEDRPRCNTAAEAQLLIVAMSGLLVADIPEETIDELLDKPFDELTVADWEAIKLTALATELLAA